MATPDRVRRFQTLSTSELLVSSHKLTRYLLTQSFGSLAEVPLAVLSLPLGPSLCVEVTLEEGLDPPVRVPLGVVLPLELAPPLGVVSLFEVVPLLEVVRPFVE